MENNRLDKNMNEMFDGYQPEVDTDAVWENIEPKLKKKKKNRFFFFWMLFGSGLLFWFFGMKNQGQEIASTPETTDNQSVTSFDNTKPTIEKTVEISEVEEKDSKESAPRIVNTSAKNNRNTHWYAQEFEAKTDDFTNDYFANSKSHSYPIVDNSLPKKSVFDSPVVSSEAPVSNRKVVTDSHINFNLEQEDDISNPVESTENNSTNEESTDLESTVTNESKPVKKKSSDSKKSKKKKSKKVKKKKKKRKRIARVQNLKWRPYFQIFGAPEYNLRSLKYTGEGSSQFVNQRKSTESQLLSYHLGGNFQLVHKKGFVFFAGMELRNIDEKFQQSKTTERTALENGIISYTVNAAGDTIDVAYGLKLKRTVTETTQTEYNQLIFLNVPIGIGYGKIGRQYGWKILGGLNYNLGYEIKAKYLDANGNLRRYENKPSANLVKAFRPKAGLNLWTSAEFFRKINGNIHWMIAPKIEVPTRGLTNLDVYPISQRYYNLSLKTGVNILLAKAPKKKKRHKRKKKRKSKKAKK